MRARGGGKEFFVEDFRPREEPEERGENLSFFFESPHLSSEIGISAAGAGGGTAWCSEIRWRARVRSAASSALSRTR